MVVHVVQIRTRTSKHGIRHSFFPTKPFAHSNPAPPLTCGTDEAFCRTASTAARTIVSVVLLTADAMIDAVSNVVSRSDDAAFDVKLEFCSDGSSGSNQAVWKSKSETIRMARRREQ